MRFEAAVDGLAWRAGTGSVGFVKVVAPHSGYDNVVVIVKERPGLVPQRTFSAHTNTALAIIDGAANLSAAAPCTSTVHRGHPRHGRARLGGGREESFVSWRWVRRGGARLDLRAEVLPAAGRGGSDVPL